MLGDASITEESLKRTQAMLMQFFNIENSKLCSHIDLREYGIACGDPPTNSTVQELCAIHPSMDSLDLSYCKNVTDVGLWSIAKHSTSLTKLNLIGCDKITNVGIRSLSLRLVNLKYLNLNLCTLLDDISVTVIAAGSWPIEEIYFKCCSKIGDNGLSRLAQGLGKTLKILDLTGCSNVGEYGDRGLKEIGANCKKLKELYFSDARRVEDPGILAIANSSGGCSDLELLVINGCENITKKSLRHIFLYLKKLRRLKLIRCYRITDNDFQDILLNSDIENTMALGNTLENVVPKKNKTKIKDKDINISQTILPNLQILELKDCAKLTDRGVAAICKGLGSNLMQLSLSECSLLTDYSAMIIGSFCSKLRDLDLTYCGHITDASIHSIAKKISCLTKLQLDGNANISTKALLSHIGEGKELEFVEMANQWLGYSPKGGSAAAVEALIAKREASVIQNRVAIKIQSVIRRKFALRIYWERYRSRLMNVVIPLFQAHVRGHFQRKKFAIVKQQIYRIKNAKVIQKVWRKYYALHNRIRILKRRRYEALLLKCACLIQRIYRGVRGKRRVLVIRSQQANERFQLATVRAEREVKSIIIQRVFRGHKDREYCKQVVIMRQEDLQLKILLERMMRFIQRIARGKLGRIKAKRRRWEIEHQQYLWDCAFNIIRVYRGHLGRLRFKRFFEQRERDRRNKASTDIQRIYRGYRGKLLSAIAKALKLLRIKHQYYSVEIQRFLRGCVGRIHFKIHKEIVTKRKVQIKAAVNVQRLFRGHKGREARECEVQLQAMESKAKPLILLLKHAEEKANGFRKILKRMEWEESRLFESLDEIAQELEHCEKTTQKYTDSSRINNTPQRFLTNFLKIRLKDHLEHETELHRVKRLEVNAKRADLRDVEQEIDAAKRELIPLTTGMIIEVKKARIKKLRDRVRIKRSSATKIQKLWRRALVKLSISIWRNPDYPHDDFLYWHRRWDTNKSDLPYYINTKTKEITWTKPLSYNYYGDRYIYGQR